MAQEYTEFDSNGDQILNQIFDFGIGNLQIGTLKYGESNLDDLQEVEKEQQVQQITLVSGNVDTITGGDLEYNVPFIRTTDGDTTKIAFDLVVQHFRQRDNGDLDGRQTGVDLEWREAGTSDPWTGHSITIGTPDGADARNATRRSFRYDTGRSAAWDVRVTLKTSIDEDDDRLTFKAQLRRFAPIRMTLRISPAAIRWRSESKRAARFTEDSSLSTRSVPN